MIIAKYYSYAIGVKGVIASFDLPKNIMCFLNTFVSRYLNGLTFESNLERELELEPMIFRINQRS